MGLVAERLTQEAFAHCGDVIAVPVMLDAGSSSSVRAPPWAAQTSPTAAP